MNFISFGNRFLGCESFSLKILKPFYCHFPSYHCCCWQILFHSDLLPFIYDHLHRSPTLTPTHTPLPWQLLTLLGSFICVFQYFMIWVPWKFFWIISLITSYFLSPSSSVSLPLHVSPCVSSYVSVCLSFLFLPPSFSLA